jgi:hypothetical protein
MAESAHPAIARIERAMLAGFGGEWQIETIVVSNAMPECPVGCRRAVFLDPRMLVRWDGLIRELAANPMGLLSQNDPASEPCGSEAGCAGAKPAADDGDVRPKYLHVLLMSLESAAQKSRVDDE